MCTCVRHIHSLTHSVTFVFLCALVDDSLYSKAAPCSVCCVHLAVLGTVGGGLASSAHEWLLQRLGAVAAQRGIAADALGRCVLRPWHLESLGTLVTSQAAGANGVADGGATGRRRALLCPGPTISPLPTSFVFICNGQMEVNKMLRPRAHPTCPGIPGARLNCRHVGPCRGCSASADNLRSRNQVSAPLFHALASDGRAANSL